MRYLYSYLGALSDNIKKNVLLYNNNLVFVAFGLSHQTYITYMHFRDKDLILYLREQRTKSR